jgi:hypothetical protein
VKVRPRRGCRPSSGNRSAVGELRRHFDGLADACQVHSDVVGGRHPLEELGLGFPIEVVGRRDDVALALPSGVRLPHHHQAIRLGIRQRPDEDRVDDGEDRRVGADAERETGEGGEREYRRPSQLAQREA